MLPLVFVILFVRHWLADEEREHVILVVSIIAHICEVTVNQLAHSGRRNDELTPEAHFHDSIALMRVEPDGQFV